MEKNEHNDLKIPTVHIYIPYNGPNHGQRQE